jgi:hypothetical protein
MPFQLDLDNGHNPRSGSDIECSRVRSEVERLVVPKAAWLSVSEFNVALLCHGSLRRE